MPVISGRVMFGFEEINRIRDKVSRYDWAARAFDSVRGKAEALKTKLFRPETRPELTMEERKCQADDLLNLAICARLEGGWYIDAALRMLSSAKDPGGFIEAYGDDNPDITSALSALEPSNTLLVSKAAIKASLALDLIAGESQDPSALEEFTGKVLVPMTEAIKAHNSRGSNWQTYHNLALLLVGLVVGRDDFVSVVTDKPDRSFAYHLRNSILPDGFWFEQSFDYHIFVMRNLILTKLIADRNGIELGGDEILKKALKAVLRMSLPGSQLPLLADTPRLTFGDIVDLLEIGYAEFHDPWCAWALGRTKREGLFSLLLGEEVVFVEAPSVRSELFEDSGICVMKLGSPESYWDGAGQAVTVTFGPHGDWHGHPGKLGIEFYNDSDYLVQDMGVGVGYALPMHRRWFTTTAAHSTVVIDGKNQRFITCCHNVPEAENPIERGHLHAYHFSDCFNACVVSADFAYPGFSCNRSLFQTPDYLLDVFECASLGGSEHTYDWVCHLDGLIVSELPFKRAPLGFLAEGEEIARWTKAALAGRDYLDRSVENGYDFIFRTEALGVDGPWRLDIAKCSYCDSTPTVTGNGMRLHMLGEPGTTVFKGECPTPKHDKYSPVVIVRRRAVRTVFVALHVPGGTELTIKNLYSSEESAAWKISHADRFVDYVVRQGSSRRLSVEGELSTDAILGYLRQDGTGDVLSSEMEGGSYIDKDLI